MLQIPFSQACERNKDPILDVIRPYLATSTSVLEIGSGTGQHALYFAQKMPHIAWQTSDQSQYIEGIKAQIYNAKDNAIEGLENLLNPIVLDVTQHPWLPDSLTTQKYDAIYTANTLHIMAWPHVHAFFSGLAQVVASKALLIVYGPFKYQDRYTSASNESFDEDLRGRGVGSAIRDFESVDHLARECGFELLEDIAMPANNQCLIWQHK